jgi:hypothetical protein
VAANLYELFHRFYQIGLPAVLGPDGTALYWALVQKSNELRDPGMFTFTNTEAMDRCGITHPQAFSRAREKVVRAGLVSHSPGTLQRTGVYSNLDRELDPLTVAKRLGRTAPPEPVDNSNHHPQGVDNAQDYPQADSQTAHTLLTNHSQTTHEPLTNHSQTAHKVGSESGPAVSISREEHNREEQRDSDPSTMMMNAPAARCWSKMVEAISGTLSRPAEVALAHCRPLALDQAALTVALPAEAEERERVERNRLVLRDRLRSITEQPLELVLVPHEARAGPEEGQPP